MNLFGKLARSPRLFNGISWGVTALVVAVLLGFTFWKITPQQVSAAPEPTPTEEGAPTSLPTTIGLDAGAQAIVRHIVLKTEISSSTNYNIVEYTVVRGDSVFGIAKVHNIKPETLLWANYDTLQDSPDSLRVGQKLNIPSTDGVYYKWQEGDTLDAIARKFEASVDDILNWPGNNIDLTNPDIKPDTYVMVPGGHREFVQWLIPTVARGRSGTASIGGAACGGGPVGSGAFVWPTGNHSVSGNEYWSGHLGIDIAAGEGASVWAADAGVVTIAQGGWNGGYGNVVMIDHGNGWVTVYGHLSQINVVPCQAVYAGQLIGLAGNTGNSFGAHLHFETRQGGGYQNPWYVLPAP
ncbi:MAG: peptidoglycan DD-metalloendopeptidase family protein [Chloroflexi bacterium]|nr:peptidoglycan DD-metalloendopeptidase family protein [Chloroflexota bacterium]